MTSSDQSFDTQFSSIEALNWKPWVGENYTSCTGNKLLIVGESHYHWVDNDSGSEDVAKNIQSKGLTRTIIHMFGLNSKEGDNQQIVRNTERALFNTKTVDKASRKKLWRSVSFYNFIQQPMRTKNHRPHQKDWRQGWDTFFKVVDILKPDHILFCGLEASNNEAFFWEALKNNDFKCVERIKREQKIGNAYCRCKGIISKDAEYPAGVSVMGHPSNYFSWKSWAKVIARQMPEYIAWLKTFSPKQVAG